MFTKRDTVEAAKKVKLSKRQQELLLRKIKKGRGSRITAEEKKEALEAKVFLETKCSKLVLAVVEKYSESGLPLTELVRLGEKGLKAAIENYITRERSSLFTYYAAWFIRAEIHKKLGISVRPEFV